MNLNKLFKNVMADACPRLTGTIRHLKAFIAFAIVPMAFMACSDSDKTAGGTTEDAGIIADLNVAGLTQKGPFVKGSAVTVQGIDCKTMEFSNEKFEGKVKSDKGDFEVKDVNLSSTCAVFEVSGNYLNELTGKKSSEKLTLHALTDLKDRKNVNINVLTELEYERVMNLVAKKKMSFAEAKEQAQKEVLASFNIKGNVAESEDLNIFEKGEGNAALLAVSVMMLADANESKLAERLDDFSAAIAKNGSLEDDAKTEIASWAAAATKNGKLDTIRKNIESWDYADSVPAFETYVKTIANGDSVTLSSDSRKSGSSPSSNNASSSSTPIEDPRASYLNPNIDYGEFTDKRDGQVYKYVEIDGVTWMAQSMNYATPNASSALCPSATEKSCLVHGLIYTWEEAVNVCPEGWHLPSYSEWNSLGGYMWTNHNGDVSGPLLSSKLGQKYTDEYGFSVTDANYYPLWSDSTKKYEGCYWDPYDNSFFWTDSLDNNGAWYFSVGMADTWSESVSKTCLNQVRCVMDSIVSSSSVASSSSVESSSSAEPPKTALDFLNPSIEYGEFVDDRDNQKYKSVKIGNQVWMAQNLNYAYEQKTRSGSASSFCYKNEPDSCGKYGRLYLWSAALDSAAQFSKDGEGCGNEVVCEFEGNVRGVCPSGWHLPDTTEFRELIDFVGDSSATKLKANEAWGVSYENPYGFSALPAGGYDYRDEDRSINPHFDYAGDLTYFWSIVSRDHDDGYALAMDYSSRYAKLYWSYKYNARSVRCIKD
jgi:uncharacterized protein (TIGR02145 family)